MTAGKTGNEETLEEILANSRKRIVGRHLILSIIGKCGHEVHREMQKEEVSPATERKHLRRMRHMLCDHCFFMGVTSS